MKSFLFLLSIFGCCVGQDLLPEGPVEASLRKNVTFKTLVDLKDDFITFTWFFDHGSRLVPIVTVTPTGETVAEGYQGRVHVNRTNGFLTLGPLKVSDRGYYNATMVTSAMKTTGQTMLRVLGDGKRHALPEGPVDAVSGKNVIFKTLIDSTEKIDAINWFFNSGSKSILFVTVSRTHESTVSAGYQGRVTVNPTNGFLTLGPLATTDSGDYYVNVFTANGLKDGKITLRVLEPVSNVTIRANVSEMVEFNSTVVLTCAAEGSFLKFSWTSGTTPIMADNTRLAVEEEATYSMLTIKGIRSSDLVGPIYCTAANQLEMEKSAPFNLTVIYLPPSSALTLPAQSAPTGLPEEEEEGGELRATSFHATTSSHTTRSPYTTLSSHTTRSPYTTLSSHTTRSPYTTLSSHTTRSPYTTLSSHTTRSPYTTLSSHTTRSPYTTLSSHTTMSPYTAKSPLTTTSPYTFRTSHSSPSSRTTRSSHTMSPYTTTSSLMTTFFKTSRSSPSSRSTLSSHTTITQNNRDTRLDNQNSQCEWFDKLQAELVEMQLSFERSLRQMESRTHSLLWSMSRRLERMTEAMDRNSSPSHRTKTHVSLSGLLSRGVSAVTPSSQRPGSRPIRLQTRGQRRRGG